MKTTLLLAGLATLCLTASGQFSISTPLISATSSTSSGGGFSLIGNISQPSVGTAAGGSFSVQSGTVAVIGVVPNPSGPVLTLSLTTTNTVVLRWPYPSTGYSLNQAPAPDSGPWAPVAQEPAQSGSVWQVVLPAPAENRFYRLKSQ